MAIDLGTLGGEGSCASGINAHGWVVGTAQTADGDWHAFLWAPDSGMRRMEIPGAVSSAAVAINDGGVVVGGFVDSERNEHPFVWTASNGALEIPVPFEDCEAVAINSSGLVLLQALDGAGPDCERHVMLWSVAEGLRAIETPYESATVTAITDSGDIIGWGMDPSPFSSSFYFPFVCSNDGDRSLLPASLDCRAIAASKQGAIVGEIDCSQTQIHACLWAPKARRDDARRLELEFTIIDRRGNAEKHVSIPHEKITFTGEEGAKKCRFTAIDPKGRPEEYELTLKEGMHFDSRSARTITYWILVDMNGNISRIATHDPEPDKYGLTDIGLIATIDKDAGWARCVSPRGFGINEGLEVVGTVDGEDGTQRALYWTRATGMLEMDSLGGQQSGAAGINDAGEIVGWAQDAQGRRRAVLWDRGDLRSSPVCEARESSSAPEESRVLQGGAEMSNGPICAVTGVSGYSGRHIARRLLAAGKSVINVTGHPDKPTEFGEQVRSVSYNFDNPDELRRSLEGVSVLYNTYWIRFEHCGMTFYKALQNSGTLIQAAKEAGVKRIVHVSITNPSVGSPLPYYNGKGLVEEYIKRSGLSYAILRPNVLFGDQGILINNIAWFLRHMPVFGVPGSGEYKMQPMFVEDLADLAVTLGDQSDNTIVDAVGPEIYTFNDLLKTMKDILHSRTLIIHLPPSMALLATGMIGKAVNDVILTPDEVAGLLDNLLVSDQPPTGKTLLSQWMRDNVSWLGTSYFSELGKHFC